MNTKDMTVGNPGKLILRFALPLMAGNVFQQLYTFVDTMVIGQALGVKALAALGAVEWMVFLLFGLIQGLVQGFSIVIAQRFGAGDDKRLRKSIVNAGYLSFLGAVIFTVLGQIMILPILQLLGTPEEIIGMSQSYLRILYAGIPIAMAYNLFAAVLRALGNSKVPLQAVTIASIGNILLDVLFVFGFHWGMEGAAAATLLAQAFSAIYCFLRLRNAEILQFEKEEYLPDQKLCWEQLKIGIPMGLQNIMTAAGGLLVQSVINGFGVLFIAGYTAANKLYGLLEIAASSYGYAMSTYAGQNLGAGFFGRIRKGLRAANIIGIVTAMLLSAVMLLFGKFILGCFLTGSEADVNAAIQIGYQFLTVLALFFPLLYVLYVTRACMQGTGNAVLPMVSSIAQLVMRTGCALILPQFLGQSGVFYGEIFAWLGADAILAAGYLRLIQNMEKGVKN